MKRAAKGKPAGKAAKPPVVADVPELLRTSVRMLEEKSTKKDRDNLARFGIAATRPFGVSMANLQAIAKSVGRSHELAAALWETGCYEARMLASFVDEPSLVTAAQMDRWCRDFDNWAICDTVCFHLFDRTPHAWSKVSKWAGQPRRVRQARGLRAAREPGGARQGGRRRAVPRRPAAHRARRHATSGTSSRRA